MAPCTSGPRLLRAAAVLLVTAAAVRSGTASEQQTVFDYGHITETFSALGARECLPDSFATSSRLSDITNQCIAKVESGEVPDECFGVPLLAQAHSCVANSAGLIVSADGAETFNIVAMKGGLLALSADEGWQRDISAIVDSCEQTAAATLGPQQHAVFTFLCVKAKLFADCDRQLAGRDALDLEAMERRARFLLAGARMVSEVLGERADQAWAACTQNLDIKSEDIEQRYTDTMAAATCTLQQLAGDDGRIYAHRLFEMAAQMSPDIFALGLQHVADACGPEGERSLPEEFIQCWVTDGLSAYGGFESKVVTLAMSELCEISL